MSMKFLTIILTSAALVFGSAASGTAFAKGGHGGHGGHGHGHGYGHHYGHYGHYYKGWGYSYSNGCYWVYKSWGRVKHCPSYY